MPTPLHICPCFFLFWLPVAWGFYLGHYQLLYSTLGVVYGAGYAADHVTRLALWFMVGVSAVACALLALNLPPQLQSARRGSGRHVAVGRSWGDLCFRISSSNSSSGRTIWCWYSLFADFINFTRKAYQLDAIQETSYPAMADLTREVIARNEDTIQNIRLWDSRPLLKPINKLRRYASITNLITSPRSVITWRSVSSGDAFRPELSPELQRKRKPGSTSIYNLRTAMARS